MQEDVPISNYNTMRLALEILQKNTINTFQNFMVYFHNIDLTEKSNIILARSVIGKCSLYTLTLNLAHSVLNIKLMFWFGIKNLFVIVYHHTIKGINKNPLLCVMIMLKNRKILYYYARGLACPNIWSWLMTVSGVVSTYL